ncbi:hypothetical protein [Staphylococcus intermedius]|uniref:Uncharacterized protein n=1 Tax=Staphylococcus intermedius NCTC 11048 TaxID=1141106 RepID=A0A380G6J6_STAIN|nr:hypothetical protein [Staphylococcus intermedius]PCF63639.1 hypothetical protein B5C04_06585 [Staphylococcus intermedius]PCF78354.1 hypothetical protein B4W74_06935 [Staphylococcus intermedius]PCF79328.1 hypothetical protein B4W70_06575 [Staphylococcus intermedius]PCF86937.1 hypothetical protein B4W76_07730 [Staphylococcus intermedius]PCF90018.1 hypothetical protein B4W75_03980 [Staphylococcus intermedius]
MKHHYKLFMFVLTLLLLFQVYFAYYYILGEGAITTSPLFGVMSLGLGVVIVIIMISVHRQHKKNKKS